MKRSKRIEQQIEKITAFRDAFEGHWTPGGPDFQAVARLAGPASEVVDELGLLVDVNPRGRINPITNHDMAFRGVGLSKEVVLRVCDHSLGILEARLEEERELERSLAGRLARCARFPWDVREAMGLPESGSAQRVAFISAVVVQIVGTVLSAATIWLFARAVSALVDQIG